MSAISHLTPRFVAQRNLFRHWTPRYVVNRIALGNYQRTHPEAPWLTPAAIALLERMLLPTDRGLEFGSGRSTLWFARRIGRLISVEDDPAWHDRISRQLKELSLGNVDYLFAPRDLPPDRGGRE